MNLKEGVNCISLAEDRVYWRAVVNFGSLALRGSCWLRFGIPYQRKTKRSTDRWLLLLNLQREV
jgi:hypothetical protein